MLFHWGSVICDQKKNKLCCSCPPQFVEAISNKQTELDNYIAEGYKNALSEERRRYCFLVDRQCAVAKNSSSYHSKVGILTHKRKEDDSLNNERPKCTHVHICTHYSSCT